MIAAALIAVNPAAGPLTLNADLLIRETTNPPSIPANNPEYNGALEANDIPRHKGRATKKTVILALKSYLIKVNK